MKETTGRDGNAGTMKPHRLICIHHPGKGTGPRVAGRSAPAGVSTDEQKTGVRPGPEPPVQDVRPVTAGRSGPQDSSGIKRPAESPAPENRDGESR
jgi:hypothetical protein